MSLIEHQAPGATGAEAIPYVAPRIEFTTLLRTLTTFDPFVVRGMAFGSQVEGAEVEVTVAGVSRLTEVRDGAWAVRFDAGSLSHYHAGVRPATVRLTDRWFNTAESTRWVTIEEFVDGFIHVDGRPEVHGPVGEGGELVASGELGLGTHEDGRSLTVMLVRDDDEGVVVATGTVEPGWHHGEWVAHLPLRSVCRGSYRVRARLTDELCASLTRFAATGPFELG